MSLKHALLGLLSLEPATGYDLKGRFEHSIRHFWNADQSQIYRALHQMEANGWLSKEIEPQEGRPSRHTYSVTDRGREELGRWLAESVEELPTVKDPLLIKVFFGGLLEPAQVIDKLAETKRLSQQRLARYEAIGNQLEETMRTGPSTTHRPYFMATLRLGMRRVAAMIEWCDETMERLGGQTPGSGGPEGGTDRTR